MVREDSLEASTTVTQRTVEGWNYTTQDLGDSTSVSERATEQWNYEVDELLLEGDLLEASDDLSHYVYIAGAPVETSAPGESDLARVSGEPLTNTGESEFVFESGTGVDTGSLDGRERQAAEGWNYYTDSLSVSTTVERRASEAWNYRVRALTDATSITQRVTEGWNET